MGSWQDFVLMIGNILFAIALLPSLKGKDKPAVATSIMNGFVLLLFALTYISLGLWFAMVIVVLTSIMWFTLAYQKRRMKNKKESN